MTDTALETTRALGRQLIDEFGRGWSRGKVDQMMAVFSADAVFVETPFSEPLRGEAVRAYWADVPAHQSEITFTSGEIFAAGPVVFDRVQMRVPPPPHGGMGRCQGCHLL